jgi:hypothetical protein
MAVSKMMRASRWYVYRKLKQQQENFDLMEKRGFFDTIAKIWTKRSARWKRICILQEKASTFFFSPKRLEKFLYQYECDDIDADVIRSKVATRNPITTGYIFLGGGE